MVGSRVLPKLFPVVSLLFLNMAMSPMWTRQFFFSLVLWDNLAIPIASPAQPAFIAYQFLWCHCWVARNPPFFFYLPWFIGRELQRIFHWRIQRTRTHSFFSGVVQEEQFRFGQSTADESVGHLILLTSGRSSATQSRKVISGWEHGGIWHSAISG